MADMRALTLNGRRGSKKVKTGCRTCKVRRVKCDEGKPGCRRCINAGRKCDGYSNDVLSQPQQWVDWQPKNLNPAIPTISPERALVSFTASQEERRSFDFYRDRTASSLAHTLDSTFWTTFILRVSHSEPSVRHALVAIGALNERLRPSTEDGSLCSNENRSFKLALSSYNKAIKCLTTQIQRSESELVALITCILFVCIEFLQDNIQEALTLVHQGCAILRGQEKSVREQNGERNSQSQQTMIYQHVMPIFSRLTVLTALAGRPASIDVADEAVQDGMRQFQDLEGARSSLYRIMEKGHALIRKAGSHKWFPQETAEIASLRMEQAGLQQQLDEWHSSFIHVQAGLNLSKDMRLIQAVSLLSMYSITTSIWAAKCLERAQTSYDAYQPQFKQIVEAAELFIVLSEGQPQSQISFTFEMGLVPPLYFTAHRCRFPSLRRQAVALMRRAPGKEGMWDRGEMSYIADRIIALEEGGNLNTDDASALPPESARFDDVSFQRDDAAPGQRKSFISFISKPTGLDGPFHSHKEYFSA